MGEETDTSFEQLPKANDASKCSTSPVIAVDYFGGCPQCGYHDGYLNVKADHWFVCQEHQVRWCTGANLFSCWREQSEDDWINNRRTLAPYREVCPLYPPEIESPRPALPPMVVKALDAILTTCTPQAHDEYLSLHECGRTGHISESLATVYGWLNGIAEPVRWMRMQLDLHRTPQTSTDPKM